MRIVFATTLLPGRAESGGELVSHAMVEALRHLGCEVTVLGYLRPGRDAEGDVGSIIVGRRPIETSSSRARAGLWMARSLVSGRPYTAEKFVARAYARHIRTLVHEKRADIVCIDHTQMAWLLDWLPAELPCWVVMHNAEARLYQRSAAQQRSGLLRLLYRREAGRLRQLEVKIGRRAQRIFVLSAADRETIKAGAPMARVEVLPVMPALAEPIRRPGEAPACDVALLGTWSWQPNRDGLRWFLDNVRPRLPRDATIHVAGRGAEQLLAGVTEVTYRGFVPDVAAFLAGAKVVAIPTRYGSGIETKMLAAIATGCAVVATPASVRGLEPLPSSVAVESDPALFARVLTGKITAAAAPDAAEGDAWCRNRRAAFLAVLNAVLPAAARDRETRREILPSASGRAVAA